MTYVISTTLYFPQRNLKLRSILAICKKRKKKKIYIFFYILVNPDPDPEPAGFRVKNPDPDPELKNPSRDTTNFECPLTSGINSSATFPVTTSDVELNFKLNIVIIVPWRHQ